MALSSNASMQIKRLYYIGVIFFIEKIICTDMIMNVY